MIPLSCPRCAGDIQLDDRKEFGFCIHCGQKVMLEERLRRGLQNDEYINNLMAMLSTAYSAKNPDAMERYIDKILEKDVKNSFAWYMKGQAGFLRNNFDRIVVNWKKALETETEPEKNKEYLNNMINDFIIFLGANKRSSNIYSIRMFNTLFPHLIKFREFGPSYFSDNILNKYLKMTEEMRYRTTMAYMTYELSNLIIISISTEGNKDALLKKARAAVNILAKLRYNYDKFGEGGNAAASLVIYRYKEFFEILDDRLINRLKAIDGSRASELETYWRNNEVRYPSHVEKLIKASKEYFEGFNSVFLKKFENNAINKSMISSTFMRHRLNHKKSSFGTLYYEYTMNTMLNIILCDKAVS